MQETLQNIVLLANKYYDYVFIDLKTNIENETTKKILSVSDVIVVNITQRLRNINNFLELKEQEDIFKKDNVILNIGTYNPRLSKYTRNNIPRRLISFSGVFFSSKNATIKFIKSSRTLYTISESLLSFIIIFWTFSINL